MHYFAFLLAVTVLVIATGGSQGLFVKSYEAAREGQISEAVEHFSTALAQTIREQDPSLPYRTGATAPPPSVPPQP